MFSGVAVTGFVRMASDLEEFVRLQRAPRAAKVLDVHCRIAMDVELNGTRPVVQVSFHHDRITDSRRPVEVVWSCLLLQGRDRAEEMSA